MLDYLIEERAHGRAVSNKDLIKKTMELAVGIGGLNEFKGNEGWLRRWKKRVRVGIRRGTNESQKLPEDFAKQCKLFRDQLMQKRETNNYPLSMIGNMDQTMVRFDMAPKSTNNAIGERTVRIATSGGSKRGFTVALCAMANGQKLPAYIVFKEGVRARIPPRVFAALVIPRNIRITASKNGWMSG